MRIVWKNMPLDFHHDSPLAHTAAMEAHAQGKFWEYHDKLFANQSKLQRPFLVQYAQELGLDMTKFERALDGSTHKAEIDADVAEARKLGVTGTPGFFINGHFYSGAKPYEEFAKAVDSELAAKK